MSGIWKKVVCKKCKGNIDLTSEGAYFDCPLCGERNDIEKKQGILKTLFLNVVVVVVLILGFVIYQKIFSSDEKEGVEIESPNFNKITTGNNLLFYPDHVEGDSISVIFLKNNLAKVSIRHRYYAHSGNGKAMIYSEGQLVTYDSEGLYSYKKSPEGSYLTNNEYFPVYDSLIHLKKIKITKYDTEFLQLSRTNRVWETTSLDDSYIISKCKEKSTGKNQEARIYYNNKIIHF